jgi:exonuclease SbcC
MAAEIAAGLAVGACCPVCGSADHPHKATLAPDAPDAAAEKTARSLVDDAELAVTALEGSVRDLTTTLAVTTEQAGDAPLEGLRDQLATALERAATLEEAAASLPALEARLQELQQETAGATALARDLAAELGELTTRIAADEATLATVTAEVDELLAGKPVDRLVDLVEEQRVLLDVITSAVRARADHEAAAAEALRAESAVGAAVAELGLPSLDEALAQVLDAAELAALERQVEGHDRSLASALTVLAEPEVVDAGDRPPPDLEALAAADGAARRKQAEALASHRVQQQRADRLAELHTTLREAMAAWLPVRAAHAVASELASFVEGKSADNQLRMRLSAYVLAWRLTQVVAAANERLLRMSDQRYTLEHTDRRGAGESRGGLSMLVRDAWSGEARDPATLSGGETFVVSLALALGLADVVTAEADGAELDTLFVDEGFGALDADTLDDVMDTLDSLRDGGRVVGVVSHVGELRTRIPTRLQVAKARHGSTLTLVRAVE